MAVQKGIKIIAENRKAYHDYFILEDFEAGMVLTGTEVKSLRQGKVNAKDSYAHIKNAELFVIGLHISPYEQGNRFNVDPDRTRKLLMHKREIMRLFGQVKQEGLALVPLKLYFKNGKVKISLGLAKGKKNYDKRESIAKREAEIEMKRRLAS